MEGHLTKTSTLIHVIPKIKFTTVSAKMRYFFLTLFVLFSLNFGVFKLNSSKLTALVRLTSLFQGACICVLNFVIYISKIKDSAYMLWNSFFILEYSILIVVLHFSSKSNLCDIYNEMLSISKELYADSNSEKKEERVLFIFTALSLLYRAFTILLYCLPILEYCYSIVFATILFHIPLISIDIFLCVHFFVIYAAYCRLKRFVDIIKNKKGDVVWCLDMYKLIADATAKVADMFNIMYVVPLGLHTIIAMISIFYPLISKNYDVRPVENFTETMVTANVFVLQLFALLFAPAFSAGLLAAKCEELKVVLHEKLFSERDPEEYADIKRFIEYVEARPLKFQICRIILLDWSLPVHVLNICVTYLIVMLQFSQKY